MDKHVIVTNVTDTRVGFTDHRGSQRILQKRGHEDSMIKLVFDAVLEERATSVYMGLQGVPGLTVQFSKDCVVSPKKSKLTIVSNKNLSVELQERVKFLRDSTEKTGRDNKLTEARMQRARLVGEATIPRMGATGDEVAAAKAAPLVKAPPQSAPAKPKVTPAKPAAAPAKPEDKVTTPMGLELSEATLKPMTKVYLLDVAKQMSLEADEGMEKEMLVELILKNK